MGDIEERAKRRMIEMGIKPQEDPSLWDSIWYSLSQPGPLGSGRAAQPPVPPQDAQPLYPPGRAPIPTSDMQEGMRKAFKFGK